MERLWAPWRMAYIKSDDNGASDAPPGDLGQITDPPLADGAERTGCIFCDKPREGPSRDRDNFIVLRGATCYVILNAFPYTNGHVMSIPYRHVSAPGELTEAESAELWALATLMTGAIADVMRPDGYNIGMNVGTAAGAGIAAHLHLHVVPRWTGDANFMPVIGDVKVLPETLPQVWAKLTNALRARGVTPSGDEKINSE